MKAALTLLVLACCADPSPDTSVPNEACIADADCSSGVCARTGECLPQSQIRKARVIWTMGGQPPSDRSCYWYPTVNVELWSDPEVDERETWRSGPLPCTLGAFAVDKLPVWFWIGGVASPSAGMWVPLDEAGVARVDLP